MKRKVSDLAPLSAEDFQLRVIQARSAEQHENADQSLYCKACKKFFKTKNSHDNHLNSKRHKDNLESFLANQVNENDRETVKVSVPAIDIIKEIQEEEEMDVEKEDQWCDMDEDEECPIKKDDCLFCQHHSENVMSNLKHMSIAHSFFIPDAEYCTEIDGLLEYLAEKVGLNYICLWCNEKGKTFYTLGGVRKHMIDKGHTMMLYEGSVLAEYVPYYDYSKSYPDHEGKDIDEEMENPILEGDEYNLKLPSGNIIGHRSLLRYYKQYINPNRAVVPHKSERVQKLLCHYRAIGYNTNTTEIANRARDIHAMKRTQAKLYAQLGCKANKLQKHFREQVNF